MNTESDVKAESFLDISEEVCPMSFVLAKLALDKLNGGERMELVCKAGEPVRNISIQLKDEGHLIKNVAREGDGLFRMVIEKGNGGW